MRRVGIHTVRCADLRFGEWHRRVEDAVRRVAARVLGEALVLAQREGFIVRVEWFAVEDFVDAGAQSYNFV